MKQLWNLVRYIAHRTRSGLPKARPGQPAAITFYEGGAYTQDSAYRNAVAKRVGAISSRIMRRGF